MTSHQVGKVYMINKKQVDDSGTVVTGMLTFNSTPLVILFDSGATHSFISLKATSQIGMESHKQFVDLNVILPTAKTVKCSDMCRNFLITLN